jgi:hypothetical protein
LSGQCSPALQSGPGDAETLGALANGDAFHGLELLDWNWLGGTPQALALGPGALKTRDGPLLFNRSRSNWL